MLVLNECTAGITWVKTEEDAKSKQTLRTMTFIIARILGEQHILR